MIAHDRVPLHRLLLTISDAMDLAYPELSDHQRRVALISSCIGRQMGLKCSHMPDLLSAALLHDIGLIRSDKRIGLMRSGELGDLLWHSEAGYHLLKEISSFGAIAEAIRNHHVSWREQSDKSSEEQIPIASYIIAVADEVDRNLDRKIPILNQAEGIRKRVERLAGRTLHPDCADVFLTVSTPESFWLDCESERLYSVLTEQHGWAILSVDEAVMLEIAEMFAQVADAASGWTATHSVGVAASAVAIAERLKFSQRELHQMRVAGYLHDIGKLTIPIEILDNPGRLSPEEMGVMRGHTFHTFRMLREVGCKGDTAEWAAFHHERLDGKGYPFRHRDENLTLGSRVMAVADIFTALTEDRPYRTGGPRKEVLDILDDLVKGGAIDGDVVGILKADYGAIGDERREAQTRHRKRQEELGDLARFRKAA